MFKKFITLCACVGIACSSIGCDCSWECLGYKIEKSVEFGNSINPELTDAYINPDNPYYNGGNTPVGGPWNHGQLNSFEKRVTHFADKLECPPCTDPH